MTYGFFLLLTGAFVSRPEPSGNWPVATDYWFSKSSFSPAHWTRTAKTQQLRPRNTVICCREAVRKDARHVGVW